MFNCDTETYVCTMATQISSSRTVNGWDASIPVEKQVDSNWITLLDEESPKTVQRPKIMPEKDINLVENVFSNRECARIIEEAERYGFGRTEYRKSYR